MIEFDIPLWQVLTLLAGVVFPLLVGLVTTRATDPGVKAVLLAALSLVTNLATELAEALQRGTTYNLGTALLLGLGTFLIAVGMHYGLWKPTHVAEKAQDALVTAPQGPTYTVIPADRIPGPDHRAEPRRGHDPPFTAAPGDD